MLAVWQHQLGGKQMERFCDPRSADFEEYVPIPRYVYGVSGESQELILHQGRTASAPERQAIQTGRFEDHRASFTCQLFAFKCCSLLT